MTGAWQAAFEPRHLFVPNLRSFRIRVRSESGAEDEKHANTLVKQDSLSPARMCQQRQSCWNRVAHAVSERAKLRPRPTLPPHRGLEFMFEAQVTVPTL